MPNVPDVPDFSKAILLGDYQNYLNFTYFNKFLTQFSYEKSPYVNPMIKSIILNDLIKTDQLKHVWNFFREFLVVNKDPISETTTQKLLKIQLEFTSLFSLKVSNKSYVFTKNDFNTLNSYYAFINEFFQIPDFIQVEVENHNGLDVFNFAKNLLQKFISFAPNQTQNSSDLNSTSRYPYDIQSPFQNFMNGSGKLALQLRNKDEEFGFLETSAKDLVRVATHKLNSFTLSSIRYNFVSKYHYGYVDIEKTCLQVFNTTECYPYDSTVNQEFQSIAQNNEITHSVNSSKILEQLLFGSQNSRIERLKTLNTANNKNNALSNFLDYFKYDISHTNQQNKTLDADFVENLSKFSILLSDLFKQEVNPKQKIVNKSLYLFLTLLKNPTIQQHELHLWPILNACANQVKALIKYPHNNNITTSFKIFSDILHATNKIDSIVKSYHQQINNLVYNFSLECLNLKNDCNPIFVLNQFSKNLGTMARRFAKNGYIQDANSTIMTQNKIIKNAAHNISESQLQGLVGTFLYQYHNGNESQIALSCKELFNLTDCSKIIAEADTTTKIEWDTRFTTIIPETITNQTITNSVTPITADTTTIHTANSNSNTNLANRTLTLTTSAAHGVGSGMLNGIIQYFATKYSRQGDQSSKAKAIAIYSSLLAHAAFAATFPFMLYKIQEHINQGNEDEAHQLWDNLLLQAFPTFISSVGFSLGLHTFFEFTQLCSDRLHKVAQNTVPFLGTIYNLFFNPLETGVQLGASITATSLTHFLLNKFSPIESKSKVNAKQENVEMNALPSKIIKNKLTRNYQFLSKDKLEEVRNSSSQLQTLLNNFIASLEESKQKDIQGCQDEAHSDSIKNGFNDNLSYKDKVINMLINPSETVNSLHDRLMEKIHEASSLVYTDYDEYKKVMEKTANVFKLMQSLYEGTEEYHLNNALSQSIGFIKGYQKNFSLKTLDDLDRIQRSLSELLSKTQFYVSHYNVTDAAYKAEQRGEARAKLRNQSSSSNQSENKQRRYTFNGDNAVNGNNVRFFRDSSNSDDSGHSTSSSAAFTPQDTNETEQLIKNTLAN